MTKYTIIVDGKVKRNMSQGQALRLVKVLKQQKVSFLLLTQK